MQILINHIGYERTGPKKAVINASESADLDSFLLRDLTVNQIKYSGKITRSGAVVNWKGFYFWTLNFSDYTEAGHYRLEVIYDNKTYTSEEFEISDRILEKHTLPDIMNYFVSQHCTGRFDRMSRSMPIHGTDERVDVHGGWYDASGDNGEYLTHLSHSIYLNPQQEPLVVWNFLAAAEIYEEEQKPAQKLLYYYLMDEAAFGGEFLVRMKSPEGFFYMGIRNEDYKDPDKRSITAFNGDLSLLENHSRFSSYKCGYREGAGISIAALARLSTKTTYGDYDSATYLSTAIQAFNHLEEHNLEYLIDGRENIVDDYCALLAATELYNATSEEHFRILARKRAESLMERQAKEGAYSGHFHADHAKTRPFYHPSDAGLPVIALLRYMDIEESSQVKKAITSAVRAALEFHLFIASEVNNPFGYGRQYVKPVEEPAHTSFFMPHKNETGYWWTGENATLASLSAMALMSVKYFKNDEEFCTKLTSYGIDQLNWILGLNPFDSCMLHGRGHNNRDYYDPLPLVLGGICNGFTGGYYDEADIAFDMEGLRDDPKISWRWTEQWIPHGAWYALAVGLLSSLYKIKE